MTIPTVRTAAVMMKRYAPQGPAGTVNLADSEGVSDTKPYLMTT